jgi:hypothetical protein
MKYIKIFEDFKLFDPKGTDSINDDEWEIIRAASVMIIESQKELNPNMDLRVDYDLESTQTNNFEIVMKLKVMLVGIDGEGLEESDQTDAFNLILIIQREMKEEPLQYDGSPYHFTIINKKGIYGSKEYTSIHITNKYTPVYTDYYRTQDGKYYGDFTWQNETPLK